MSFINSQIRISGELISVANHYRKSLSSRIALTTLVRGIRVLFRPFAQQRLNDIPSYREYVLGTPAALQHVSCKKYVFKGLSLDQRFERACDHFKFENEFLSKQFLADVYGGKELVVWQEEVEGRTLSVIIRACLAYMPEGNYRMSLCIDGKPVHNMSFSWFKDEDGGMVPFVARNQGLWKSEPEPLEWFEAMYPNNSPSYFCYAALQGIAQAIGARRVLAVKGIQQYCYDDEKAERVQRFVKTYDEFWKLFGGEEGTSGHFEIPVPFYLKPLSEVTPKHRKRSAMRRAHWARIEEGVCSGLTQMFRQSPKPASAVVQAVPAVHVQDFSAEAALTAY
ncbi:DUF535 family protein [Roseateles sp. BYS180W]|uniref:DUF535 family protein n=1 Tax=Roseateles rivi TaxID=3299028 RepID=A0ABW7FSH4_9BURK